MRRRLSWACGLLLVVGACTRDDARAAPVATTPPPSGHGTPPSANPATPEPAATPIATATTASPPDATADATPAAVVTIMEIDVQAGPLGDQLAAIAARAKAQDRVATVELWAGWCAPCKKLDKLLGAGAVTEALRGTILIRVDVDMFDDELTQLGFTAPQIPSMYRIDGRGKPVGKPLSGADWAQRSEAQIAAALRAFLAS